ncbi:MAG: hypothetical protein IPG81_01550 [Sandaracinaceae bacterium]|nr:hypothetical protein [Sandaracinaceae bacterium]
MNSNPLDVPAEDGNECTVSACTGTTPVQTPNPLGVPCNTGLDLCNGNGACVDCLAASDCGFDTFCAQFACVNNTCQQTNTAVGTDLPAGSQAPLDCQVIECDGAGGERSAALNTDVPVDGNACTNDVCTAGAPSNPPTSVNSVCAADGARAATVRASACSAPRRPSAAPTPSARPSPATAGRAAWRPPRWAGPARADGRRLPGAAMQRAGRYAQRGQRCGHPERRQPVHGRHLLSGRAEQPQPPGEHGLRGGRRHLLQRRGELRGMQRREPVRHQHVLRPVRVHHGRVRRPTRARSGPAGRQPVPGDCQVLECNGSGAVRSAALNTDVPSDGNSCTQDVCTAGVPSNPNRPLNYVCRSGDYCDGAGTCVDRNSADQCGTDSFCRSHQRNGNTCGQVDTTAGVDLPVGNQTTGDCQVVECNGLGAPRSVALNTDVFVDGIACTDDLCTAGVPSNPDTAMGASCTMGGRYCDGAGSCLECLTDEQCGTTTFCYTYTCNSGTCEESFRGAGATVPTGQTTGDCRSLARATAAEAWSLRSSTPTCRTTPTRAPTTRAWRHAHLHQRHQRHRVRHERHVPERRLRGLRGGRELRHQQLLRDLHVRQQLVPGGLHRERHTAAGADGRQLPAPRVRRRGGHRVAGPSTATCRWTATRAPPTCARPAHPATRRRP